ncbi:type II toxin-antitoxin system PrlF family antitoxin [Pararhizobium mangrovi]|uniref:AbrB/MazE/SpoVT family DNA-binding domain-containing protein n=1 Tax=Pararhizobium mangrovi TaxID=2590452 RepID=A0A506UHA4_9HYPH|nr:type II toxin-antitoxin system PrlF family antitoxin [Pararhizobium mangrovi]TPW32690.1 AbrB/MazE/SpoVT family DNA-binding domain-containing protein [Pararhizobium mangrovi]
MRMTSKGQVTIPRDLRELAGLGPRTEVIFAIEDGKVTIARKHDETASRDDERLKAFLAALDRLEGTGNPNIDANAVMRATRGEE